MQTKIEFGKSSLLKNQEGISETIIRLKNFMERSFGSEYSYMAAVCGCPMLDDDELNSYYITNLLLNIRFSFFFKFFLRPMDFIFNLRESTRSYNNIYYSITVSQFP